MTDPAAPDRPAVADEVAADVAGIVHDSLDGALGTNRPGVFATIPDRHHNARSVIHVGWWPDNPDGTPAHRAAAPARVFRVTVTEPQDEEPEAQGG